MSVTISIVFAALLAWTQNIEFRTVDGPETKGLASSLTGYIIMDQPLGGILALDLATREAITVRPARRGAGLIHAISGPDSKGRIAYVLYYLGRDRRHLLKTVNIDGSEDTVVFQRPGDPLWKGAMGRSVALAAVEGRIAFVGKLSKKQMREPPALLRTGPLEIWSADRRDGNEVIADVVDQGLFWFPDGKRLAFVKLVPRDEANALDSHGIGLADGFGTWDIVPVIHIFDIQTGAQAPVCVGWKPIVSSDGKSMIVRDLDRRYRRVVIEDRQIERIDWPGNWRGPIALLSENRLLYWGLPTSGTPPSFTKIGSPLVGRAQLGTIKLAEFGTNRFETLIPGVDPRRNLSVRIIERP